MSTTEAIGAPDSTTDERAEFVKGLREFADFIEGSPTVPCPKHMTARRYYYGFGENSAEQFKADALALGGEVVLDDPDVEATRKFSGDIGYTISIPSREVCEQREVTSTAFVLPPELDPNVREGKSLAELDAQKPCPICAEVHPASEITSLCDERAARAAAQDDPRGEADR